MAASFWSLPTAEPLQSAGGAGAYESRSGWAWALLLAAVFFLTQLPQLRWLEFSGGSENLNVATVLELQRAESWWVPTLRGQPRLIKPPLTAWVTASAARPDTFARLDNPDPAVREAAYRDLAVQVRLPALLATTLTLLAVFEAGRLLVGRREGLVAMAVAATCLLTLRFGRFATTDVMLTLFTAWTWVALLHAYLRQRIWVGLLGAGVGLALGMMSKGPVVFVFTLIPFAALLLAMGRGSLGRRWLAPGAMGLVLFAVIGLAWFADQFRTQGSELLAMWRTEVLRKGATQLPPDPWYTYASLVPMLLPWAAFFLAAVVAFAWRRETHRAEAGLLWGLLAAVVVMSLFEDKNERYLLPAVLPASLLIGSAVVRLYASAEMHRLHRPLRDAAMAVPWAMGLGLAVGGAVGGKAGAAIALVRTDGSAWHSWALGGAAAAALIALLAAGAVLQRRWWPASFLAAALGMSLTGALFLHGYAQAPGGAAAFRTVAELLRTEYPDRPLIELRDTDLRFDHELNIYLNRVLPGVTDAQAVTDGDAVLLMIRRASAATPTPPEGWHIRHTLPAHKRTVHVLERAP